VVNRANVGFFHHLQFVGFLPKHELYVPEVASLYVAVFGQQVTGVLL